MSKQGFLFSCVLCVLGSSVFAQRPSPGAAQTRSVLVTGGLVHVGDGRTISEGAVGFRNGTIDYVGYAYGVKASYDTVINVAGKQVYPGFILADNTLGLGEIDMVRSTVDDREQQPYTPEARTIAAYNSDSWIIPTVRSNGVLISQVVPRGGPIAGTGSVVQLDAWDPADALLKADGSLHVVWPTAYNAGGWWAERSPGSRPPGAERAERINELRERFRAAKAYAADKPSVRDVRMEAMAPLFAGGKALYVHADRAREIQEAVAFARELGIARLVIVGGYDAWRVADLLRDRKVDVVLRRVHELPLRDDDPVDLPYRLPALLHAKGVRFCLSYAGDMERMGSRNLPFLAGTAAAYGLEEEAALRAITLDAAIILGIGERYGSLEVGKSATLLVSDGDALDMRGNAVRTAWIDGRVVELDDHQKRLYRQYRARYARP